VFGLPAESTHRVTAHARKSEQAWRGHERARQVAAGFGYGRWDEKKPPEGGCVEAGALEGAAGGYMIVWAAWASAPGIT
jgi:hypothetical protein